jgi:tetratricopeptide (TPR) repeat protein
MHAALSDNPQDLGATQPADKPAPTHWLEPRRTIVGAALLALLIIVAYAPVVRDKFIWDDDAYVTRNPTLRSIAGLRQMWLEPLSIPQYYPLVHTTFWIEYHLWGLNPLGYHLVNVLLHATSAWLLWRLLKRLEVPGAWLAAALFAVHPVCVESVVWVTERKNVLSLALVLSSMIAYFRFAPLDQSNAQESPSPKAGRWVWYALSWLLFFAALLSKTVVATMPAVILVIVWWKRGCIGWRDVVPLLPFFVIGGIMGRHTAMLEKTHVGAQGEEWDFTPVERGLIAGRAIWFYAGKLAWPYPLIFFYHRWNIEQHEWWQYLYPATALVVPVVLWMARRRISRGPLAAALVYGGVLMPALGFFNVYPFRYSFVADHFQYHASLALFALAGGGAVLAAKRLSSSGRAVLKACLAGVLLVFVGLSFQQTQIYENLEVLYRDTIAKNQTGVIAYSNLAAYLGDLGRNAEALDLAREAIKRDPEGAGVHNNLGAILLGYCQQLGDHGERFDESVRELNKARELNPNYLGSHCNLAVAMLYDNRPEEAVVHLRRALEINPRDARSLFGMGSLMTQLEKPDEARHWYAQALARDPDLPPAHYGLGLQEMEEGHTDDAILHLETALRLEPAYTDAHYAIATALSAKGEYEAAAQHYRRAVELRPTYVAALVNLGIAELRLGNTAAATTAFENALTADPQNNEARLGLAVALVNAGNPTAAIEHFQKLLAADPSRADVQFQLANAFVALKQMDPAIEHYAEAVRLRPDYLEALQNLGAALLISEKVDEAIPYLEKVLQLQPQNPQARANLEQAQQMKRQQKSE